MRTGVVCNTKPLEEKGYGFITPDNGTNCISLLFLVLEDQRNNNVNILPGNIACIHIYAGNGNLIFHFKGKGNADVKSLIEGQRVNYTEGSNNRGACAENVVCIEAGGGGGGGKNGGGAGAASFAAGGSSAFGGAGGGENSSLSLASKPSSIFGMCV